LPSLPLEKRFREKKKRRKKAMEPMEVIAVGPTGCEVSSAAPIAPANVVEQQHKGSEAVSMGVGEKSTIHHMNVLRQVQAAARRMADEVITWTGRVSEGHPAFAEFGRDPEFIPEKFVSEFVASTRVSPMCVVIGLMYLRKLVKKHTGLKISSTNASRLVLVASMSAAKYMDDQALRYTNAHWVYLTGQWLSARKLGFMEREFLVLLGYELGVSHEELREFCAGYGVEVPIGGSGFCE
jgi:hypothetical protein